MRAWLETIPNFIFQGQLWDKDRYDAGFAVGKPRIWHKTAKKTHPRDRDYIEAPYPPEEETAVRFEWTPELQARFELLARKRSKNVLSPPRAWPSIRL